MKAKKIYEVLKAEDTWADKEIDKWKKEEQKKKEKKSIDTYGEQEAKIDIIWKIKDLINFISNYGLKEDILEMSDLFDEMKDKYHQKVSWGELDYDDLLYFFRRSTYVEKRIKNK